jgi:tripartite-type tricarboxylate transporter receptor subunit TctC
MAFVARTLAALVLAQLQVCSALTQDYPVKPIRIVTAGSPDIIPRIFGKKFTDVLGQPIVAESIPSAGGKLAAETVARSRPDGYTLLNIVPSLIIASTVQKDALDFARDFAPVASTNHLPYVLVVSASLPVRSVADLVALAKSKPGELNYGGGNASFPHIAFELFKAMTRIEVVNIPYKTANDQVSALLSGQTQAVFATYGLVAGLHQSGKLRALAVTTAQRSRLLPELPTLAESGLPGYDLVGWNGFIAPSGTPVAVRARLNAVVRQALKQTDVLQQLAAIGYEPGFDMSPEQFGEFLRNEATKWKKLVAELNIKID